MAGVWFIICLISCAGCADMSGRDWREARAIRKIEAAGGVVTANNMKLPVEIWLNKRGVTDADLLPLEDLGRCARSLHLDGSDITDAGLVHLEPLAHLEILNLSSCRIGDAGLDHVAGLSGLEQLFLWDTGVTDAGLKHLEGLKKLEALDLSGTMVTDAGLESLRGLRNLQRLSLNDTAVTDRGIDGLRAALPGCAVGWRPTGVSQ